MGAERKIPSAEIGRTGGGLYKPSEGIYLETSYMRETKQLFKDRPRCDLYEAKGRCHAERSAQAGL